MPLNFLHPFRFIRRLPPLASPPLLTFLLFQYPNFPGINNFLHASCLNICIPTTLCQVQKSMYRFKETMLQGPKTSSPMWAPITMEFPPPYGGKVHTGPKNRNRAQKQLIWLSKEMPLGPAQIHAGPKQISPQGPENTQARPPHFLCPQVQKKSGQVQKTCIGPKKGWSKKHASPQLWPIPIFMFNHVQNDAPKEVLLHLVASCIPTVHSKGTSSESRWTSEDK